MHDLLELMNKHPVVPFIRESDFAAVRKPWRVPERRLLDYLLIYIKEGECRFTIDGTEHLFAGGEFCFIQPGSVADLEGRTDTVTPFAHLDIFYHPDRELSFPTKPGQVDLTAYLHLMQPRLNDIYGVDLPVRLQPRSPSSFADTFLDMIRLWQHRNPVMQLKAQKLATELIIAVLEDHHPTKAQRTAAPSLSWINSYLSFHLAEPLSVQDMANRANLSVSRFTALFKQLYGVAPHQYLLELRIRHAQDLLETTDLPQEVIASYCGFADVHHFSKAFKKRTGSAPGAVRTKR
ncbi:AraC family transcriptional regulator [Paenibacillus thermotolerans]|uniref:AraC family transcriptional regulator n=1 Tax=Paenibacillus thermotolerans TaxID=3027807 RepID=UPI002368B729|nr:MULTISPECIES: AraC family transcriptional regulator [unclassified Paenibacillus]